MQTIAQTTRSSQKPPTVFYRAISWTLPFAALAYYLYLLVIHPATGGDAELHAYVSRCIMMGHKPLVDFWSHHMDLFLYIFGYWMSVFGFNFTSGQTLSALLVFLSVVLAGLHMKRLFGTPYWFSVLCAVSLISFMNASTKIDHHAVSNPMFLASFCFLTWPNNPNKNKAVLWRLFFSGFCLSVAANSRILYFALFPVYIGFSVV